MLSRTSKARVSEYRADQVVVAIPPLLAQQIEFRPALPVPRATAATGRGCAVKVHLSYPAPIWREHGLSGWSVSADGPLLSTVDDSPPDESAGVLTGFVTGAAASEFSSAVAAEQQDAALAHVGRLFPELPPPTQMHGDRLAGRGSTAGDAMPLCSAPATGCGSARR